MFTIDELLKATGGTLLKGELKGVVSGISTDSRTIQSGEAFLALRGRSYDGHGFIVSASRGGSACIIAQRFPAAVRDSARAACALVRVKDSTRALGDIARYHRGRVAALVIGVTGSNGKTTTKDMIAAVLSSRHCGVLKTTATQNNHIGVPQTVLGIRESHSYAVIELGTNHPGEIAYVAGICRPNIGVVTSIGPSHLEFLRSLKGVEREKMSLARFLENPALLIVNADDPVLGAYLEKPPRSVRTFGYGIRARTDFRATVLGSSGDRMVFSVNGCRKIALPMLGLHNVYNSLAAIACARLVGVGYGRIRERLESFVPPPGRMNVLQRGRIRFIDDTYNANPLSVGEALSVLGNMKTAGRKIAVLGDMLELGKSRDGFHRRAGSTAARVCDALITVGQASRHAARGALEGGLRSGAVFACSSVEEARQVLFGTLYPCGGDVVLVKGSRSVGMERIFDAL